MTWKGFDALCRSALTGAVFGFIIGHMVAAYAGWPFPDSAAYGSLTGGVLIGLTVDLWPWPARPKHVSPAEPYTGPTPALVEALRVHQDWQEAKLRQAVEPHAIRLGMSADVLMTTYSDIQAEMKRVGAA